MEQYFFEAFKNLERLAPGSEESTLKAIASIDRKLSIKILDIGAGVGTHTMLIARELVNAKIIAIDNNAAYIDILNKTAISLGINDRVKGICMSMFEMTFEDNMFDYIFSEGAIYIAGFTEGLTNWKRYLKPKGMLICSEISWIVDEPSQQIKSFWDEGYAQMDSIAHKIFQAKNLGYNIIDYFILPKEDWIESYYAPLQRNLDQMREKYFNVKVALEVVDSIQHEIDLYHKYGDEYSYVFYILQVSLLDCDLHV
ncbi:MAG: hypothetical protein BEN18_11155 [Epulopiscium sp. Nuni2H_MBin001]|nr:MAG: hypothetical protein BEN18_11155 [Epulopiscium sp. Nuni2H_MBin001]